MQPRLAPWIAAALALAAALPAAAQDPEAAYAGYHRAALNGDFGELMRFADDARRTELAAMSPAQRSAESKMAGAALPPSYSVRRRDLAPNGETARLYLAGQSAAQPGAKPEMLFGTARMVKQRGDWRVAGVDWSNVDPGLPAHAPPPRAAGAAGRPAPAAAAAAQPAPQVGAIIGDPVRKLGRQKPPCVYKPVMTQEDIDNCK